GTAVGAMVIGFLMPELIPQPKTENPANRATQLELLQSGILFEDRLYANPSVLPEPMAAQVGQEMSRRIHATQKAQDEFDCEIQNRPYRIFYELLNQGSAFPPAYQVCLYSMEEVRQEQKELRWEILGSGGFALIAALLLSVALLHGLV